MRWELLLTRHSLDPSPVNDHKRPRVLIIGAGYLGLRVAQEATCRGWQVVAARRSKPSDETVRAMPLVHWHQVDVLDVRQVRTLIHTITGLTALDAVFYCVSAGGPSAEQYRAAYHFGLENVIQCLPHLPRSARLVFVSSTGVIPVDDGQWVDESYPIDPESLTPKYRSLFQGEQSVLDFPGAVVARLSGIYGPGRTRLIQTARELENQITIEEVAWTNRIHVADAARAVLHLASLDQPSDQPSRLYHVTDSDPAARHEVLAWLHRQCTGGTITVNHESNGIRKTDAADLPESNKRIRNELLLSTGFSLDFPSYREGYGPLCSIL